MSCHQFIQCWQDLIYHLRFWCWKNKIQEWNHENEVILKKYLLTHEFKIQFKRCDKHVNNYQLSQTWIFVTAQVGYGPDNIAKEGIAGTDFNQSYEGFYDAKVGNQITEFRPIAGDIAKCPYGLFTNIQILEKNIRIAFIQQYTCLWMKKRFQGWEQLWKLRSSWY